MRRFLAPLLALFFLGIASAASATERPTQDSLTRDMAARIRQALPNHEVETTGPLTLRLMRPGGAGTTVNLDRVWRVCQTGDAEACEGSIANFVGAAHELVSNPDFTRAQLRVMVRSEQYCMEIRRIYSERQRAAQTRSLPGALCVVLVADAPNTMRVLGDDDLADLGLASADAWSMGERQTLANLPSPTSLTFENGLAVVAERDYVPSLILASDGWRSLAAAHGDVLMAVPKDGVMIVLRASETGDLSRLRQFVADDFANGERGISPDLFRWTEQGWAVAR
jgi:hypothetical protein